MKLFMLVWLMTEWNLETIALAILAVSTASGCLALLIMFLADIFGGLR